MAKICSKRAIIYWSFLPLEIFEIIRRIAYFHNLIHFDDFFVAISGHFLFYFQAMCETDGEFPEESCISSPPPTFNQHLFFQFNFKINRNGRIERPIFLWLLTMKKIFCLFFIMKTIQFLILSSPHLPGSGNIFSFVPT